MFRRFEILSKFYIIKRPYYIDVYVFIFNNIAFDSYRMTVVKILHSYRVTVVKLCYSYRVTGQALPYLSCDCGQALP
jgi:hypothetical protein